MKLLKEGLNSKSSFFAGLSCIHDRFAYSETEYFIVEYRKQEGMYESNAQGSRSGLLAYRVNPDAGDGNAQGPPDELYVIGPGGTLTNSGNLNNAPYSPSYGQTELNDNTDPSSFLYNGGQEGSED
ncbi:MAG: hypothetical protein CM15mP64_6500 [Candidatus Neomarinimicrobiota bacterium]|nr:MAG: hypothetical protein CM15mP64_6500 [Candidatus Neomarinimicrobiota bacterium]